MVNNMLLNRSAPALLVRTLCRPKSRCVSVSKRMRHCLEREAGNLKPGNTANPLKRGVQMRLGLPLLLASISLGVPAAAQPANVGTTPVRFTLPVCPGVYGLAPQQAAFVTERMRQVAAAAGMPLANQPCDPNAIVIVASNKTQTIRGLEKKKPSYFPVEWSDRQIHALERDPYPAAAWQFEGLLTPDGIAFLRPATRVSSTRSSRVPSSRRHRQPRFLRAGCDPRSSAT